MMKYERKNLNIVIRGLHNRETEVEALWVVAPSSLMVRNQCFECRATSIFRVEVHDQGDGNFIRFCVVMNCGLLL